MHVGTCRYALTGKEVLQILKQRLVKVDGKVRTDTTYPAGFMDVIDIDKTDEHFRLVYDTKGENAWAGTQSRVRAGRCEGRGRRGREGSGLAGAPAVCSAAAVHAERMLIVLRIRACFGAGLNLTLADTDQLLMSIDCFAWVCTT